MVVLISGVREQGSFADVLTGRSQIAAAAPLVSPEHNYSSRLRDSNRWRERAGDERRDSRAMGKKWTHKKAERMEWEVQMRPVYPALKVGGVVLSVVSAPSLPFFSLPFHPGTIHI